VGMGIPMGMGMGWVWGLKFNPHGSPRAAVGMGIPMGMGMGIKIQSPRQPWYLPQTPFVFQPVLQSDSYGAGQKTRHYCE